MRPFEILARYHDPASDLHEILVIHSVLVARKAVEIARMFRARRPDARIDEDFLVEAALLHDIGIGECDAPEILCRGREPYIRHGVIGRRMLEDAGLPRHGLVCERHTGAGITQEEVVSLGLPIPPRDYLPVSLEEKIVCVADKFFGKKPAKLWKEKTPRAIEKSLAKHGEQSLARWHALAAELLPG